MKRLWIALLLVLLVLLTGCADGEVQEKVQQAQVQAPVNEPVMDTAAQEVKTGLAVIGSIAKSMNATPDFPGAAHTEVTFVALTLDRDGVIRQCCIDGVSAVIPFDATGALQEEEGVTFASKNELGDEYAMHKASAIGSEWREQADAFARYAVGRKVEELSGGDVATSVTISTDAILQAIAVAAENAVHQGARIGDELTMTVLSHSDDSRSASLDTGTDGCVAFRTDVAAVTWRDGAITSCCLDALETVVPITPEGLIGVELSAAQPSMAMISRASPLAVNFYPAQEWYRRAESFANYMLGKTAQEMEEGALEVSGGNSQAVFCALLYKAAQQSR